MREILAAWLLITVAAVGPSVAQVEKGAESDDITASAIRFVELLEKKDFPAAVENFDETMTRVMPPEKVDEVWTTILAQVGPLEKRVGVRTEKASKYDIVLVTCKFERATLDVKVVFDAARKISGLFFVPSTPPAEYKPPDYVKPDSFEEKVVQVGAGEWVLPGTLTLPKGEGPFPAVVLVHGSGPQDRDETIGPNKPFRDLAWGLGSRGVAVLRYEKRTKVHGAKIAANPDGATIKAETVDDALAAVSLLRNTPRIDRDRIFVLGHSLGGMVAPGIAVLDRDLAGLIIFAGNTRRLEDLFLDQRRWFAALDGEVSESEKAQLEELEAQVARVKDPKLSKTTPSAGLPGGAPAVYWLSLRAYDPRRVAEGLKLPMLIVQGQRDYQVTMEDYQGWKETLSDRENVQFKLYPKCNHLFVEGEGQSTPAEYAKPGNVAEEAVDDVAAWIREH